MRLFSRRAPSVVAPSPPTVEAIFRDQLGFLVSALLHFGIAPVDVEDAAHEVIRAVLRSLPTFDPSRDLRSWLFGVAFNVASNHLRRTERHRARFVDDPTDVVIPDLTTTIEERMIQDERHRAVREALDEIPLSLRAVLLARVVHGMSELETAESLAIPRGTVKTRLRMAKQELRDGLQRRERAKPRVYGAFILPMGALLANEALIPEVPADMRARLWEQLQAMIAQPSAPANDDAASPGPGRSPLLRRLLDPDVGRLLGGAFVGGALVFALGPVAPSAAPTPTPARESGAAITAVSLPASVPVSAMVSTTATAPTIPNAGRAAGRAVRTSAPLEPSDPPDSTALMRSATVALERHDIATARRLLEQQAHDFPRSKLATSRELLWVRVLLSEGKRAEAQAKADALRKASPTRAPITLMSQ
jgi:RNA polymerase sigma factor (sigma-70 family)